MVNTIVIQVSVKMVSQSSTGVTFTIRNPGEKIAAIIIVALVTVALRAVKPLKSVQEIYCS